MQKPTSKADVQNIFMSNDPICEVSNVGEWTCFVEWANDSSLDVQSDDPTYPFKYCDVIITSDLDFSNLSVDKFSMSAHKFFAIIRIDGQNHTIASDNLFQLAVPDMYLGATGYFSVLKNLIITGINTNSIPTQYNSFMVIMFEVVENITIYNCYVDSGSKNFGWITCWGGRNINLSNYLKGHVFQNLVIIPREGFSLENVCFSEIYEYSGSYAALYSMIISAYAQSYTIDKVIFRNKVLCKEHEAFNVIEFLMGVSSPPVIKSTYSILDFYNLDTTFPTLLELQSHVFVQSATSLADGSKIFYDISLFHKYYEEFGHVTNDKATPLTTKQLKSKTYLESQGWKFSEDDWIIDETGIINDGYPYFKGAITTNTMLSFENLQPIRNNKRLRVVCNGVDVTSNRLTFLN